MFSISLTSCEVNEFREEDDLLPDPQSELRLLQK